MHRFLVVFEKADKNYSAYSPDVPGCVATGTTVEEAGANMKEALEVHVAALVEDGQPIPRAPVGAEFVEISI